MLLIILVCSSTERLKLPGAFRILLVVIEAEDLELKKPRRSVGLIPSLG
jgi:hypothetical protein